jgi:hypothetical protein
MNRHFFVLSLIVAILYCHACSQQPSPLIGTWKLLKGTTIEGKDSTVIDYTQGQEMIKIITPTHFAFLRHDLSHGKDSTTAVYSAGGGRAQHLDYLELREWENHSFEFEYSIKNDTLTTKGLEKVDGAGINRINIEQYIRVTNKAK